MSKISPRAEYGAYWLGVETAIGHAWLHLEAAGIPSILLKGPVIATWLYVGEFRYSQDIDLLVSPATFRAAQIALADIGYVTPLADAASCEIGPNATSLRHANGSRIDLHHRLIGTPAEPPERCWDVLSMHTAPFVLGTGTQVRALDMPARTMHLALHAAQNGPLVHKPMADLRRGLAQIELDTWREAFTVAQHLGSVQAFAEGLRLCDEGVALARDLDVPRILRNVEMQLRITSAPLESLFFTRLVDTPGIRGKAALVGRKLWPTEDYMRMSFEAAGRGRMGLLLSHALRPVSLLRRSGPAVKAWVGARLRVGRDR